MKALDKIYLPIVEEEGKRLLSTIWWPEDNRPSNEKFVVDAIPYIRKDALLEWLNGMVYEYNIDRFDDGFNAALGQVIDKINSM